MRLTRHKRLARIAQALTPAKPPYYVRIEDCRGEHTAPGWYWQPADADTPVYLGATAARAEVTLVDLRDLVAA